MKPVLLSLALITLLACAKPDVQTDKQYPLTGKVVAINAGEHTATIDAAAIPNFMEAMKMDYPIANASDLASMKVGENISATVKMHSDGSYTLADIHARPFAEGAK